MHNLASNNKHSHGVEGSETSLLQCVAAAGQFLTVTAVSSEPKASSAGLLHYHSHSCQQ